MEKTWEKSESIAELAAALAKAQGEMTAAKKDSENPHFRSKYADLAAVLDACREPLSKNGIAIIQLPASVGSAVVLTTVLAHSSGQWISSTGLGIDTVGAKNVAHAIGSIVTYLRRYSLSAAVGISAEDDDGNQAPAGRTREEAARQVLAGSLVEGRGPGPAAQTDGGEGDAEDPPACDDVVPAGKNKGKRASELTDKSLLWYATEFRGPFREVAQREVEKRGLEIG